jgi:hypothetical protein
MITSCLLPDGRPGLWAVDTTHQVWSAKQASTDPSSRWEAWTPMPGTPPASSITVVQLADSSLELFIVDVDHQVWHCWMQSDQADAGWTPWRRFPNQGDCLCVGAGTLPDGRTILWAFATNHQLFRCVRTSSRATGSWTKWTAFEGGQTDVLESPAYCTNVLAPPVLEKWNALATTSSVVRNVSVRDYLGAATTTDNDIQYFQRGMIVPPSAAGAGAPGNGSGSDAIAVHGDVYLHYRALRGPAGPAGLPLSDLYVDTQGGYFQYFSNGEMHSHPTTGTFLLRNGPVLEKWKELGGAFGRLGRPINDDVDTQPIGTETTVVGRFQYGTIQFSPSTGAHAVEGPIRDAYETQFGCVTGALGLPIGDQTSTPTSGGRFQDFQHGCIVWHPAGSPYAGTFQFQTMQVTVQRIQVFLDSDEILSGGISMYAWHDVSGSAEDSGASVGRLPPDEDDTHDGDTWEHHRSRQGRLDRQGVLSGLGGRLAKRRRSRRRGQLRQYGAAVCRQFPSSL